MLRETGFKGEIITADIFFLSAVKEYSFTSERKNITAVIISPLKPVTLKINGISRNDLLSTTKKGSVFIISISSNTKENSAFSLYFNPN